MIRIVTVKPNWVPPIWTVLCVIVLATALDIRYSFPSGGVASFVTVVWVALYTSKLAIQQESREAQRQANRDRQTRSTHRQKPRTPDCEALMIRLERCATLRKHLEGFDGLDTLNALRWLDAYELELTKSIIAAIEGGYNYWSGDPRFLHQTIRRRFNSYSVGIDEFAKMCEPDADD